MLVAKVFGEFYVRRRRSKKPGNDQMGSYKIKIFVTMYFCFENAALQNSNI